MDQLKEQLAVVMKHGFWIGSAIVFLGSLGIWYMTTSKLDKETQSQSSKITQDNSTITQVRGELPTQPNNFSHVKMDAMVETRKEQVLAAWQSVFDAQTDILTWPELTEEFVDRFKYVRDPESLDFDRDKLKLPVEYYVQYPPQSSEEVPAVIRRTYAQHVGKVLPDYAKIAKAEWTAEFTGTRARGGAFASGPSAGYGRRQTPEVGIAGIKSGPVVTWTQASQEALLKDLFPWAGQDPSTLEVYYSQENLWILRQLMRIIANVNGDAQQSFEAKIREIKKIGIGKSVKFGQGSISKPGRTGGGGMAGYGGMDEMMDMDMDMDMGMGDTGGGLYGADEAEEVDPADSRYVNTALEPITGSELRGAFTSNSPGSVALAVVKRVPVMLRLQMDQRAVDDLLAACANAPLRVDVRQVRELPKGSTQAAQGGGMGGEMGGMMENMMEEEMDMAGMGGMGGMGGISGGAGGARMAQQKPEEEFPLDMDVEVYGLIHFYNPPNEEALGIEKVTDEVEIDSSVGDTGELPAPNATTPPAADPNATAPPAADPNATAPPAADPNATAPPVADPNAVPADPATDPGANPAPATQPPAATAPPAGTPATGTPAAGTPAAAAPATPAAIATPISNP